MTAHVIGLELLICLTPVMTTVGSFALLNVFTAPVCFFLISLWRIYICIYSVGKQRNKYGEKLKAKKTDESSCQENLQRQQQQEQEQLSLCCNKSSHRAALFALRPSSFIHTRPLQFHQSFRLLSPPSTSLLDLCRSLFILWPKRKQRDTHHSTHLLRSALYSTNWKWRCNQANFYRNELQW